MCQWRRVSVLTLDIPNRLVRDRRCEHCHGTRKVITGFVHEDDRPYVAYIASCYPHNREVWLDVIFGTWHGEDTAGHETFGCHIRTLPGEAIPSCMVVQAASVSPPNPVFGHRLSREQALVHPLLSAFWAVVDLVLRDDYDVHVLLYQQ